ncbi:aspartyl/glutamyl-tRNA amidotransferase subunit C [bacterium]|jgi:aspartyl-tRNA(Asn)/glutamyl-tRNA(Gln) amidotransferase subunit C|nr:aspartyl/glutamyl-tRNA amidotransferase subunit C [bacterium]MBT3903768.1 aspartyl/glutamyl-tRNA amidotransferase subunit C [bacterium]MBT4578169.1 aspartyl/glutamyl-tRNA amidotransferase subunit C [bacterium]MBT5345902.1 aspartyl/glutamyl-tRNA amidotransferase subunit C [bacterium]MBT6131105.1 aspartyl/glutamyl-tRNA amidotransferase subunit C [bacterium]
MATITPLDIKKLAKLSNIALREEEIAPLTKQIDDILSYAQCVVQAAQEVKLASRSKINVFRPDQALKTDPEPLLAQAPQREQNYFVVPVILKKDS